MDIDEKENIEELTSYTNACHPGHGVSQNYSKQYLERNVYQYITPSLRQVHVEEKMKTKDIIKKDKQHQLHAMSSSILLICPLNNN